MEYRNKRTGEVISVSNKITGKNWEPVKEDQPEMGNEGKDHSWAEAEGTAGEIAGETPAKKDGKGKGKK